MGKVIAFVNSKGGGGKTTFAWQLGNVWSAAGRKVLLIDTDPQGTLSIFYAKRPGQGLDGGHLGEPGTAGRAAEAGQGRGLGLHRDRHAGPPGRAGTGDSGSRPDRQPDPARRRRLRRVLRNGGCCDGVQAREPHLRYPQPGQDPDPGVGLPAHAGGDPPGQGPPVRGSGWRLGRHVEIHAPGPVDRRSPRTPTARRGV